MKTCTKCGKIKKLGEYYPHKAKADGHLNMCKECSKAAARKYYGENRAYYMAYEKVRAQRPERKAAAARYQKARKKRNPSREACRYLCSNAIRDGRLIREPCAVCGEVKVEAHHEDHMKPLGVTWLCRKHHLELHGKVAYESKDNLDDA